MRAFLGSALCLCLASAVALAAPTARGDVYKVGDFAMLMARTMYLPADNVGTAINSLRSAGVQVVNPEGRLTEGDVVAMLSQARITVTTANPEQPVDRQRATGIISAFSSELSRNGGALNTPDDSIFEANPSNPNDDFNNGNGSGGKFKRKKKNCQTGSD
ncbi:MAG TPA: hypothetical protein VFP98_10970 [Candidatus Polarisedimenticolia bacterium]|nr:hypothetical protein [Candidatus Polarisedimenticolia bacterium]